MEAPTEIVCPECQEPAHRVGYPPDEGYEPGDVVAYVCGMCEARFDLVLEEDDTDEDGS